MSRDPGRPGVSGLPRHRVVLMSLVTIQAALGTLAVYVFNTIAQASIPDANLVINLASLAILVGGLVLAPRAWRAKNAEAQLAEKDAAITTKDQTITALRERDDVNRSEIDHLRTKVEDCEQKLQRTHAEAAMWSARYQEQQQYTAQPALESLKHLLENADKEAQRRHTELLEALRRMG